MSEQHSIDIRRYVNKTYSGIEKVTSVTQQNGDIVNIYKYTDDSCDTYFSLRDEIDYIGYIKDSLFYIVNLKNDVELSSTQKNEIDYINLDLVNFLVVTSLLNKTQVQYKIRRNKIEYFITFPPSCIPFISLDNAKLKIDDLNTELKCVNYSISINYVFEMKENTEITSYGSVSSNLLLLCLFDTEKKCVSSLVISVYEYKDCISFDSRTHPEYEGNKINKLLRAVIIIIAKILVPSVQYVRSHAINIISLNLMTKYFNAIPYDDADKKLVFKDSNEMKEYFIKNGGLTTKVFLDEKHIKTAERVFSKVAQDELVCDRHAIEKVSEPIEKVVFHSGNMKFDTNKCYAIANSETIQLNITKTGERTYYTTEPLTYLGKYIKTEYTMLGSSSSRGATFMFNNNGTETKIDSDDFTNNYFTEVDCVTTGGKRKSKRIKKNRGKHKKSRKNKRKSNRRK